MFESMLVITIYLLAIFTPVLVPATVHAVHFFSERRLTGRPAWAVLRVRLPRPALSRRVPVPAAG